MYILIVGNEYFRHFTQPYCEQWSAQAETGGKVR